MKKIWFDIVNTPQVHFLMGIKRTLEDQSECIITVRDVFETVKLTEKQKGISKDIIKVIGNDFGKKKIAKIFYLLKRFGQIYNANIDFDVSISCGSEEAIWTSALRGKKSIAFGDNDTAPQWTYGRFVDYVFFPNAISEEILTKQGISRKKLYLYDGYKEDLYLADYEPDKLFLDSIPFNNYVLVRPENSLANYIKNGNIKSITPILLKKLEESGHNIIYLPKYDFDRDFANGVKNIYIPNDPISGLDAVYYSDAVLTGAGTFAREAGCLSVPSVSFFAGKKLLAVDQKMVKDKWVFHSRDAKAIVNYLDKSNKHEPDLSRSKQVRLEVKNELNKILEKL